MLKYKTAVVLIAAAAFISRAATFLYLYKTDPGRCTTPDSASYENPAIRFLHQHKLLESDDELPTLIRAESPIETKDRPMFFRTPGYPLFIAAVYKGIGHSRATLVIIQILLSALTLYFIHAIAVSCWNHLAALLAMCLYLMEPLSFISSQQIMSETVFTLALMASLYATISALESERLWLAALSGELVAGSTLIRPVAYFLLFVMIAVVYCAAKKRGWQKSTLLRFVLAFVSPWIIIVGSWQVRNELILGTTSFSGVQAYNLLFYRAAGVRAYLNDTDLSTEDTHIFREVERWAELPLAIRDDLYSSKATEIITRHPALYSREMLTGLVHVVMGPGEAEINEYLFGKESPEDFKAVVASGSVGRLFQRGGYRTAEHLVTVYAMLFLICLYCFGLFGILRMQGVILTYTYHIVLIAGVCYFLLIASGPDGFARMRTPVMPILCIYAGAGASLVAKRMASLTRRRLAAPLYSICISGPQFNVRRSWIKAVTRKVSRVTLPCMPRRRAL